MTGKIKMVLLAITLCLGIGLRSMGAVQAAVYSEACPFCGTMVSRGSFTRVLSADFMQVCDVDKDCNIYWVVYGEYTTVTCQTPSCQNYGREVRTDVWSQPEHYPAK